MLCLVLQVGIVSFCCIPWGSWHPLHPTAHPGCWPQHSCTPLYTPHPCTPSSPALITPSTLKYPRTSATTAPLCPASSPASTAHTACAPQTPAPPAPQASLQPAPESSLHPNHPCTQIKSSLPPAPEPSRRHHLEKLSLKQAPGQSTASKATKAVTGP